MWGESVARKAKWTYPKFSAKVDLAEREDERRVMRVKIKLPVRVEYGTTRGLARNGFI